MPKTSTDAQRIVGLTLQISRDLRQQLCDAAKEEGKGGVNMLQMHALVIVAEHEGLTMKDFANMLHITAPSATSFINRLVRGKLVQRKTDPTNRRVVRLKITPQGSSIMQRTIRQHNDVLRSVIDLMPSSDQRAFVRILVSLLNGLQKHRRS